MSNDHANIDEVIEFFEGKEVDRLDKMVRFMTSRLEEELSKRNILARVSARVKSSHSLRSKLEKWQADPDKMARLNGHADEILRGVSDLAAARVMTYTEHDRDAVVEMATQLFSSPAGYDKPFDLEKKEEHPRIKNNERNHYRATHMMVAVSDGDLVGQFKNLNNDRCELQITSLLAHVWNEIEHDTIYKTLSGELSELERDAIDSLGHLTKTGDNIIKSLLRARQVREAREEDFLREKTAQFSDAGKMTDFLETHFGSKINGRLIDFKLNSTELFAILNAVNWHNPRDVASQFSPGFLSESRKESLRLQRFLEKNSRTRPTVDADSCDLFAVAAIMKCHRDLIIHFDGQHKNKREVAIFSALQEMNSRKVP